MSEVDCSIPELMAHRLSAEIDEGGVAVLGSMTPLAYAAYMLAKLTRAPGATLIGFNAVDMAPIELSLMGSEAAAYKGSTGRQGFLSTVNSVYLSGRGEVECVSMAQLDAGAAINLSVIGDYDHPKVRLPGGAGAPEVIQNYRKMVAYTTSHDRRTFVRNVDFVTGRRFPVSGEDRRRAGLTPGPIVVVTPLAVLTKVDDSPFRVTSLHPGVELDRVVGSTGFEVRCDGALPTTPIPTPDDLRLLRERIDPFGTIAFDFLTGSDRRELLGSIIDEEWARASASRRTT